MSLENDASDYGSYVCNMTGTYVGEENESFFLIVACHSNLIGLNDLVIP